MKLFLNEISAYMEKAFAAAGYDAKYGRVTFSNRPDLCEFQCNGAMAAAKEYHKAPIMIAQDVKGALSSMEDTCFSVVDAVAPGFLNLKLADDFLTKYMTGMRQNDKFGLEETEAKSIVVDYGGPNVAKPLHVGHLRAAIIGESVKRICKYMGNNVIGDVHLGDWGLQMGLIISELQSRKPELCYFDPDYTGEYPEEAPFTLSELEEIYPTASAKSKVDESFKEAALRATFENQQGRRGYRALWKHIMNVSLPDLHRNYDNLNVSFDWWNGESDVESIVPGMVDKMKDGGFAYESEGALVVDVAEETDSKEIPPCMILKSDGAALYTTTDLATLLYREEKVHPDQVIYVVDKRQDMHFVQVFRCAKKTGVVNKDMKLDFLGFGTMNGKDGKPFKTREGGVMRLETLINDIREEMYKKISENHTVDPEEGRKIANVVALAAIKYGDLSNQATKDYVFDLEKFTSFEGNTGPYILYTIVRIKSILNKYVETFGVCDVTAFDFDGVENASAKDLMIELAKFSSVVTSAYEEIAPHKICAFIYDVSNAFNRYYHETKVLVGENDAAMQSRIALLALTRDVLENCIDLLGFESPERM